MYQENSHNAVSKTGEKLHDIKFKKEPLFSIFKRKTRNGKYTDKNDTIFTKDITKSIIKVYRSDIFKSNISYPLITLIFSIIL